jgi:hypothetical protein
VCNYHWRQYLIDILKKSLQIFRDNLRIYLILNLFFYGLMVICVVYMSYHPELARMWQHNGLAGIRDNWLAPVYQAYAVDRNIPLAALLTFVVNLVVGSGLMLSLPSLVIPFSGLLVMIIRFASWGVLFAPAQILRFAALGTLLLEGQGYILASMAIVLQGSRMVRPKHYGFASLKDAYMAGLKLTAHLYVLVTIVLLVAALFESTFAISTSKPLFPKTDKSVSLMQDGDRRVVFSGSIVFYNAGNTNEADAKVVGALMEDIRYFQPTDSASVRISRDGAIFDVALCLPTSYWDNEEVRGRFAEVCKELNHTFADRRFQITAISLDSTGSASKKIFY